MKVYDFNFLRRIFIYMTIVLVTFVVFIIILVNQLPKREEPKGKRHGHPERLKFELIAEIAKNKNISKEELSRMLLDSGHGHAEFYKQNEIKLNFILQEEMDNDLSQYRIVTHAEKIGSQNIFLLIRLDSNNFLSIENPDKFKRRGRRPPPFKIDIGGIPLPILILLSVVFVAIISILVSFIMLYVRLRIFSSRANVFISEIKKGNLSERFRPNKKEAFYETMVRFNTMASYIEDLVTKIKDSEETRINVLQELSHDLRTPITSLKNLMETITSEENRLSESDKTEILVLAKSEVLYFEKLVEDLLIWARINEPKYQEDKIKLKPYALLTEEVARFEKICSNIRIVLNDKDQDCIISGHSYLLKRMFRNLLDNAVRYAKEKIEINYYILESELIISIHDDGDGFSEEQINNFGKKKFSRVSKFDNSSELSIGLGSVIAASIANLHKAKIVIMNESGGKIFIKFPIN